MGEIKRVIKFRAWHKANAEMLYEGWNEAGNQFNERATMFRLGDSVEIMQFTGLLDKNGKEIYEGDIVQAGKKVMKVTFEAGCYRTPYGDSSYRLYGWPPDLIEIIGNVHEHPNLINPTP